MNSTAALLAKFKKMPFDLAAFNARQCPLDYFGWHGWAMRYAGQSRLWAAMRLLESGDAANAAMLLKDNLSTIGTYTEAPGMSEKTIIARSYAGLAMVDEAGADAWAAFLALPWAAEWMAVKGLAGAEEAWAEVV